MTRHDRAHKHPVHKKRVKGGSTKVHHGRHDTARKHTVSGGSGGRSSSSGGGTTTPGQMHSTIGGTKSPRHGSGRHHGIRGSRVKRESSQTNLTPPGKIVYAPPPTPAAPVTTTSRGRAPLISGVLPTSGGSYLWHPRHRATGHIATSSHRSP